MSNWSSKTYWSVASIVLILIAALTGLNVLELRGEEPRRAIVAIELLMGGDPLVLQLNGQPYLNKPPLYTYILALTFELLGSFKEWTVRLPGVLSYIVLAGLAGTWFARYIGRNAGLLTFLFLMSCFDILFYGLVNAGEIDLFYALITFVQVMAIFHFEQRDRPLLLFLVSYLFMALGGLTKGLPSILFQGLTLIAWLGWQRKWTWLLTWRHLIGLLSAGLMIGTYFALYAQHEPIQPYLYNLVFESFDKSAGDSGLLKIIQSMVLFPFHLAKLTLPWSVLLLVLLWKKPEKLLTDEPIVQFALLFCMINLIPYWISPESRGRYLYMFFPFILLLPAYLWTHIRLPSYRWILGVVLLTALLRITYTLWIMPLQQDGTLKAGLIYRQLNEEFLEQTEGQHIHLYGRPDTIEWPGWLTYQGHNYILTPPIIPYQIPYYQFLNTGKIMSYDSIYPTNNYLLKYREDSLHVPDGEVLYRFEERLNNKQMELIQLHSFDR